MGYTTEFEGRFEFSRELTEEEASIIHAFSEERHGGNLSHPGYPGYWCDWDVSADRMGLEWNGAEKFYNYIEWLELLIARFFDKWDVQLNGQVRWQGEDLSDVGVITVDHNSICVQGL